MLEEQVDAPKARKAYNDKDDAAYYGFHPAEKPTYQIKLEKTDQAPVNRADDRKDQCKFIHIHLSLKSMSGIVWGKNEGIIRKSLKK